MTEHAGTVEYDLLRLGLDLADLGTPGLSWGRAYRLCGQIAADETSATCREIRAPHKPDWPVDTQVLARIEHTLRVLAWQNGGGKRKDYPEPLPILENPDKQQFGDARMTLDEAREWLGWAA